VSKSNGTTPPADTQGLAEALAPFLIEGETQNMGDFATFRTPADTARAFADLAARIATLPDDALLPGWPLSISISMQPWAHYSETDDEVTTWIDGIAEALGGEAARHLMPGGKVHYTMQATLPGGARVSLFAEIPANEQERADHLRRQAGHRVSIRELGTVAGNGHALVRATCSCQGWEVELPRGRALHFWGKHADKAVALLAGPGAMS
jgi:hypothetical protein